MVEEGKPAPDFELSTDNGARVKLSSLRGKPVVLYFYPKDDTPGCTTQACGIRDAYADFRAARCRRPRSQPRRRGLARQVQAEVFAPVHAARRSGAQGRRAVRRLEGAKHVRQEVNGHRALNLRDRRRRQRRKGDAPREAGHARGRRSRHPGLTGFTPGLPAPNPRLTRLRGRSKPRPSSPKPGGLVMRRRFTYVVLAALRAASRRRLEHFRRPGGEQTYVFNGRLLADAGSSTSLYVDINGGNKPALKKLVGQSDNQYFAVGAGTQYLRWAHGVPTVVAESNLVAGDVVSVQVRAARDASLAQIERRGRPRAWQIVAQRRATQAGRCGSSSARSTAPPQAARSRSTFRAATGSLSEKCSASRSTSRSATGTARSSSSGEAASQPLISPSQLKVGDRISIRIRAPRVDSLQQAELVPATHVGDHEPHTPS